MTPWGRYLSELLAARDLSARGFSEAIGVGHTFVGRAMRGTPQYKDGPPVKPPLDKVEAWADALGLESDERDRFIELAELAHAPDRIARRYLALKARVARLEQAVDQLQRERGGR